MKAIAESKNEACDMTKMKQWVEERPVYVLLQLLQFTLSRFKTAEPRGKWQLI